MAHQLKDLYSAEDQLTKALPKMVQHAKNDKLKKAFEDHLEETHTHKKKLEDVGRKLGIDITGETCKGMQGLIREAEEFLKSKMTDEVLNAGMIAGAQRVEHYEIAGYGTVCTYAEELGLDEVAEILKEILSEEKAADEKLKKLAKKKVNEKAID